MREQRLDPRQQRVGRVDIVETWYVEHHQELHQVTPGVQSPCPNRRERHPESETKTEAYPRLAAVRADEDAVSDGVQPCGHRSIEHEGVANWELAESLP